MLLASAFEVAVNVVISVVAGIRTLSDADPLHLTVAAWAFAGATSR